MRRVHYGKSPAPVAELADALDLGSSVLGRVSSSLTGRTIGAVGPHGRRRFRVPPLHIRPMMIIMKKLLSTLIAVILIAAVAATAVVVWQVKDPVDVETESSNTKVIKAVEREEQVVLVSLGMEGLSEESATSKLWNWQVPGSERTQYIKYSYRAKLGIEGSQVQVEEESPHHFRVQIPEFIFIGHSDENFETAVEDNGALSWITPDIDKAETITKILNEDKKKEDIADNRDVLQSQAKQFYTGIISGVDPEAEVDFSFR